MSEILFRAKQEDTGLWVFGSYLHTIEEEGGFEHHDIFARKSHRKLIKDDDGLITDWGVEVTRYLVYSSTVCQYIGVTDRKGHKIFEGDILSIEFDVSEPEEGEPNKHYENAVVVFSNLNAGWYADFGYELLSMGEYIYSGSVAKRTEIIGNIYDDPGLAISILNHAEQGEKEEAK